MEIYVDYDFYQNTFYGSSIPESAFFNYALRASIFLKYITGNRIAQPYPEEVRLAACAVADVFQKDEERRKKTDGRDVKSVNNDGYSVTYTSEAEEGTSVETITRRKAYNEAAIYLEGTGLLSRCIDAKQRNYYDL